MIRSKENNRIEALDVISRLEYKLNQKGLNKGNRIYFDCLKCDKKQNDHKFNLFRITNDSFGFKCLSCGFSGNMITLIKDINLFDISNYSQDYITRTKAPTPGTTLKNLKSNISYTELKEILNYFFSQSTLTDKHKKEYIKKRDSEPDINNTFSFDKNVYKKAIEKYGTEKIKQIFYHQDKKDNFYLEDCILFTTRDLENNIIHYEVKRYKDKFQSQLRNLGLNNKLPVFLNYINDSIKIVIICEGTEKAQTINEIFQYKNILAVSIGSIQRHDLLKNDVVIKALTGKEIIISFDSKNLSYITYNEEKASINLSKALIEHDLDVYISFLPRPTNTDIKEHDFDSYFYGKDKNFRENTIYNLVNQKLRQYDFYDKYKEGLNPKKEILSNKRKHLIKSLPYKHNNLELIELSELRDKNSKFYIPSLFENELHYNKGKVVVFKIGTGGGKSHAICELMKSYRVLVLTHNKELANQVYRDSIDKNLEVELVKPLTDIYYEKIDCCNNLNDKQKEKIKDKVKILTNKGYSKEAKNLVQNTIKAPIEYIKPSPTKHLIATQKKALVDNSLLRGSFDVIIIDEDITDKLIESNDITLNELKNDLKYYHESNFTKLLRFIIEYSETKESLNPQNFKDGFIEFLKEKKERLLFNARLRVKQKKLELKNLEPENYPNQHNTLKKLIESIKNNAISLETVNNGFNTDKVLSFDTLETFETKNTLFILDADADIDIIEACKIKVSKTIEINIKRPNVTYIQYPNKTYKTSNILGSEKQFKDFKNQVDSIKPDLIFTTQSITNKFNNEYKTAYYGNHDKGFNNLSDNKKAIFTTPKINENSIIRKSNLLFKKKIKTFDTSYKFERTGYLDENNQETYIESFCYKDKYVDKLYQKAIKTPMNQAIGRITRNTKDNIEVHIFSNISLYDKGIRINKIIVPDKSSIDLRQEKTIEAEKIFKQIVLNSLSKYSIVSTENFINTFFDNEKKWQMFDILDKKSAINSTTKKPEASCLIQFAEVCNNIYNNTENRLMSLDLFSIDRIMTHLKENFNISSDTFNKIKKDVFSELSIKTYYLDFSKQGTFYTDNFELANQIIEHYKKTSKIDVLIKDSVNTPNYDLKPGIGLKNDSLDNTVNSNEVQKEVFAPAGEYVTVNEQKENILIYEDYVKENIDYLNCFLDKYLDNRIDFKLNLDSKCFDSLEDNYNEAISKKQFYKAYDYEFILDRLFNNYEFYKDYVQDIIQENKSKSAEVPLIELKDIDYKNPYIEIDSSYIFKTAKCFDLPDVENKNDIILDNITPKHPYTKFSSEMKRRLEYAKAKTKIKEYLLNLKQKNKVINDITLDKLKVWVEMSNNQDNYNDKRIFYNSIKSNYLEYNRFIQGYTQNIKIQV